MKVKDRLAQCIRDKTDSGELCIIADQIEDFTNSELEADALLCPCGAILPFLYPFVRIRNHYDEHKDQNPSAEIQEQIKQVLLGGIYDLAIASGTEK